jgi:hypothetical protein
MKSEKRPTCMSGKLLARLLVLPGHRLQGQAAWKSGRRAQGEWKITGMTFSTERN